MESCDFAVARIQAILERPARRGGCGCQTGRRAILYSLRPMSFPIPSILAASPPDEPVSEVVMRWLTQGGFFLWLILAVAGAGIFISFVRMVWMRRNCFMPRNLVRELENLENDPRALDRLRVLARETRHRSPLARITYVAFQGMADDLPDLEGAVEARARREVTAMHWGLAVLEVIVTISPLLGLLGTASGLVRVFTGLATETKDVALIALGVGQALVTTIAGLAVAVPAVLAHSVFLTSVERCAVEMEVLMHRLVGRLAQARDATRL